MTAASTKDKWTLPDNRADAVARQLARVLAHPGKREDAVRVLRRADGLFDALDQWAKTGVIPSAWHVTTGDAEAATLLYDTVSEELRTHGGVVAARAALGTAHAEWERLDGLMREGSPLPEPWQR
ncbi:hypothetical protein [Nocardiopsis halotolerans]|uniref:hypothetical protein n=1 Tax=Nocardiopsis halotolerans TaxID=124252 RepID=UPI000345347C|nr:hypothetical protein [Nocardiopsis halotolerans]